VTTVDLSKDGRWLLSCGEDCNLYIWNKLAGNIVSHFEIDSTRPTNVQWLPDGKCLLADTEDGLGIWKFVPPISRQFLVRDELGTPQIGSVGMSLKFSPAEDALFFQRGDLMNRLDLEKLDQGFELIGSGIANASVFVSQAGDQYGSFRTYFESPNLLQIFSLASQSVVKEYTKIKPDSLIIDFIQLDDGRMILSEFVDRNSAVVRQLNPEKELLKLKCGETTEGHSYAQVAVAERAQRIAIQYSVSDSNDNLMVYDLNRAQAGKELFKTTSDYAGVKLNAAGNRLAFRRDDNLIVVDVDSGDEILKTPMKFANRYDISDDGRSIVILDHTTGTIRLFDSKAEPEFTLYHKEVLPVWVAISATGKWLAICDSDSAVRLWNLDQLRRELKKGGVLN
jgi:hypothetical protein